MFFLYFFLHFLVYLYLCIFNFREHGGAAIYILSITTKLLLNKYQIGCNFAFIAFSKPKYM
jgi:hypothetical protein